MSTGARIRTAGRVAWFNFDFAKELQLIPTNHANRITSALERVLLDTFALQIINEYDLTHDASLQSGVATPQTYMATRYLQAQHKDKLRTNQWRRPSDLERPRSEHTTKPGTSVAAARAKDGLSPVLQIAGEPVKTGDDSWGYLGTGESRCRMLNTALMSEIFHRNGFPTERTLLVIDFGDGTAIGVRAAPNLMRPAHIFRYLKQGRHQELKASLDYFIARQVSNGEWTLPRGAHTAAAIDAVSRRTYLARVAVI